MTVLPHSPAIAPEALIPLEMLHTPVWLIDPQRSVTVWANTAAKRLAPSLPPPDDGFPPGAGTTTAHWTVNGGWVEGRCTAVWMDGAPAVLVEGRLVDTDDDAALKRRCVETVRHTGEMVSLYDLAGGVLMRNPAAEQAFGGLAPVAPDRFTTTFANPERAASLRLLMRDHTAHSTTARVNTADGERWHDMDLRALIDPDTGEPALLVIQRDVTARRQLQRDLQHSEERLALALDASDNALWDWMIPLGRTVRSPRWETMLGYRPGDLDPSISIWVAHLHPDDSDTVQRALKDHLQGLTITFSQEYRLRARDGGWVWVLDRGRVVEWDGSGRAIRMLGTLTDITARKKAEAALASSTARLEAILANAPVGIAILDSQRRFLRVNEAMSTIFRLPMPAFSGASTRILYPDDAAFRELGASAAATLDNGGTHTEERPMRRGDDTLFWCRLTGRRVSAEDCGLGHVWILEDISDRRAVLEALQAKTQELQRSNRDLEAFAYVASHDLRQPLRVINSYLSLLEQELAGRLDGETTEYIGFARDGAQRMDRMIVGLLDYARAGRGPSSFHTLPASTAVEVALQNLEIEIEETGAEITVRGPLPAIHGNENDLIRLFQNLIGNALKYRLADHRPQVTVGYRLTPDGLCFMVGDDGIGIAPEHQERVFGIFQRLHRRDEYDGTGIGLAVCKKIVEHHGGRIWVESSLGHGSTFFFTLPSLESADP